jgi:hypothetical protein
MNIVYLLYSIHKCVNFVSSDFHRTEFYRSASNNIVFFNLLCFKHKLTALISANDMDDEDKK